MEIEKMTTSELEQRLSVVVIDLAKIRNQVENAKSNAANGEYSDPQWFNRARHALRMTGIEHQRIMQELAKRRKAQRRDRNDRIERRFMDAAKRRLSEELFLSLMDEAEAEINAT